MVTKIIFRIFILILLSVLLFTGCSREIITSSPVITTLPTINLNTSTLTGEPKPTIEQTHSPTKNYPTPELTSATNIPLPPSLQLTFVSGYKSVYAIDVNCLESDHPCPGEPKFLFNWEDWISALNWSPDGKHVAFISGEYSGKLYISDWNGANAIQITGSCSSAGWPQWSPDGTKVIFIYAAGMPGCDMLDLPQIQVFNTTTNQITTILNNAYDPRRISWLPEGNFGYISMMSSVDRTELINIVESDGKIIKQLPENASEFTHIFDMSFSNDGLKVAFVGVIHPNIGKETDDIYVVSVEGSNIVNLTNGLGHNFRPAWSPNTNWLAFESNRSTNYEIYLIKSDGTGLIQITHDAASFTDPAWRELP